MTRLPRIPGDEVVRRLERNTFKVVRIHGSHYALKHDDGPSTVVPVHGTRVLGPGMLRRILNDSGLTADDVTG